MKELKKQIERAFFAMPKDWSFEESENKDIILMIGDRSYAVYDNSERMLTVNAYYRNVSAKFYVRTNEVKPFDVKRMILRFIEAEGSLEKGVHKGFVLMSYSMPEEALEELMEEEAEYIRPTAAGQGCSWWSRPDGLVYLKDEKGQIVTAYDRSEMTYMLPFSDKVVPIPTHKKACMNESSFREALEIHAMNVAEKMEGGVV